MINKIKYIIFDIHTIITNRMDYIKFVFYCGKKYAKIVNETNRKKQADMADYLMALIDSYQLSNGYFGDNCDELNDIWELTVQYLEDEE